MISHKYNASKSSIYKIVKEIKLWINGDYKKIQQNNNKKFISNEEQQFIKEYVNPPQMPLTIQSINERMNQHFGIKNRKREIKEYLKKSLHYSYKKGGATTFKGGTKKTKYLQSIFSSRVLLEILRGKLIINVDEWVFNRDLKRLYSWLPKGVTNSIICSIATGRWSMISAILSNGEFLCIIVEDTGNSKRFCDFLCILWYAIEFLKIKLISECILVLDNASTHVSKYSTDIIKYLKINTMFLPAYSPMLAPVELFFRMT